MTLSPTIKTTLGGLLLCLFFAGMTTVARLSSSLVILLALTGIVLIIRRYQSPSREQKQFAWVCAGFLGAALLAWAAADFQYQGTKELGRYVRLLFFIPLVTALFWLKPKEEFFWLAVGAAACVTGVVALYQHLVMDMPRSEGATNAILFGCFALTFSLLSLIGAKHLHKNKFLSIFLYLASPLGLLAAYLSGTRNAWLSASLLLPIVIMWLLPKGLKWLAPAILVLGLMIGTTIHKLYPQNTISVTIERTVDATQNFFNGEKVSSTGKRLDMWEGSWDMFLQNPILGVGLGNYLPHIQKRIEEGLSDPGIGEFSHAHSSYFFILATRGLVGITAFFLLLGWPLYYFCRQYRANKSPMAQAGIITIIGFACYATTEAFFNRSIPLNAFTMFMACFYYFLSQQKPTDGAQP